MSTLVEFITAVVISVFGISAEKSPVTIAEVVVIECCETTQEPSSDMLILNNSLKEDKFVILNSIQKSIKIEHNRTEKTLL